MPTRCSATTIRPMCGKRPPATRAGWRNPRARRHDLLIAATAERHGLSLATRNIEDFRMLDRVLHVIEVR